MTVSRMLGPARLIFVMVALAAAAYGFRGRWTEVLSAIGEANWASAGAAFGAVMCGLALTSVQWRAILKAHGVTLDSIEASRIFFRGQLGKYIPGSVWSVGAQGGELRNHAVPARVGLSVGLLFLWVNVVTACLVAVVLHGLGSAPSLDLGSYQVAVAVVACCLALAPPVLRLLAHLITGKASARLGGRLALWIVTLNSMAWAAYGVSIAALIQTASVSAVSSVTAYYCLAYAAGVVVVLAPAGVGVREAVLITLLTPQFTLTEATAVALLARVTHTLGDALMAGLPYRRIARRTGRSITTS